MESDRRGRFRGFVGILLRIIREQGLDYEVFYGVS